LLAVVVGALAVQPQEMPVAAAAAADRQLKLCLG
jgi:hypothetical protein